MFAALVLFVVASTQPRPECERILLPVATRRPAAGAGRTGHADAAVRADLPLEHYGELRDASRIRIEIEPDDADVKYWAFVAVTNNETQQITTLTVH